MEKGKTKGKACAECGVEDKPLQLCGRCRSTYYCSGPCQKAAWKTHKLTCLPKKAMPSPVAAPEPVISSPDEDVTLQIYNTYIDYVNSNSQKDEGLKLWDGRGRPPWYPSSPPWFHDEFIKRETFVAMGQSNFMVREMLGQAWTMHNQTVRYKLLNTRIRQAGERELFTFKEFSDIVYECGFLTNCTEGRGKKTLTDWRSYWHDTGMIFQTLREDAGWKCPCRTTPVYCDRKGCNKLCTSVCLCEESYCSPECLSKDWSNHRSICMTVKENNELAETVHQISWACVRKIYHQAPLNDTRKRFFPSRNRKRSRSWLNEGRKKKLFVLWWCLTLLCCVVLVWFAFA